jgi:hypothetical protein
VQRGLGRLRISARTRLEARETTPEQDRLSDPEQTSQRTGRTPARPTGGRRRIRDPPDPEIDVDEEFDEELRTQLGFSGATFENPTRTLGEASEAIVETLEFDNIDRDVDNLF